MKKRLDVLIAERGLSESREKAKALIMSGEVYVNGQKADKAGEEFSEDAKIEIAEQMRYVSRGGLKLEKAMQRNGISLEGAVCADFGASTGGFTDCMLQNGASKVYAVDVGYGQLAWKLRSDPRVICLERTNARYITEQQIPDKLDFFSMDVSFISVRLILSALTLLLAPGGAGVVLIKPQFEAGRGKVGKNGVVRDKAVHIEVVRNITAFLEAEGFGILGLDYSPIKGPKGNIEFLAYAKRGAQSAAYDPAAVVESAHGALKEDT